MNKWKVLFSLRIESNTIKTAAKLQIFFRTRKHFFQKLYFAIWGLHLKISQKRGQGDRQKAIANICKEEPEEKSIKKGRPEPPFLEYTGYGLFH